MKRAIGVFGLVVALALPAFAVARMSGARPSGVVTGAIFFGGGPYSPHRRPQPGVVTVFKADGVAVRRVRVRAGHHFRLTLAPGRYELCAGESLHPKLGCEATEAQVKARETTRANVYTGCPIP
jgi:hypothetical protein